MADRGIIFSAPMVRALLAGRKTQTRRLLPDQTCWRDDGTVWTGFMGWQEQGWAFENRGAVGRGVMPPHAIGDRLYVREAHRLTACPCEEACRGPGHVFYDADGEGYQAVFRERLRPSIHMPRWASRMTLLVREVRVQRLQDISAEDALAEGHPTDWTVSNDRQVHLDAARDWFMDLWNSLHTKPGERWEDNPWIVAVSFDVEHRNIDR